MRATISDMHGSGWDDWKTVWRSSWRRFGWSPTTTWPTTTWESRYLLQENYPEAVRHLQRAVDLSTEFETAHNNLGVALKGSGDLEGAVHHLEEAIRLNPNYAEAYKQPRLTLKDQGKLADAAAKFRRALSINPGQTAAKLNLDDVEAQIKRATQ